MSIYIIDKGTSIKGLIECLPPGSHEADEWLLCRVFPVCGSSAHTTARIWVPNIKRSDIDFALLVHQRNLRAKLVYNMALQKYPPGTKANLQARQDIFGISDVSLDEFSRTLGLFACDGALVGGIFFNKKGPALDDAIFDLPPDTFLQAIGVFRCGNE